MIILVLAACRPHTQHLGHDDYQWTAQDWLEKCGNTPRLTKEGTDARE